MSRLPDPDTVSMTAEERATFDARGAGGPSSVWRWVPAIAEPANALVLQMRNGSLDRRLYRVMCLVVARTWTCEHVFRLHKRAALEEGVAADVIEAIRTRRVPPFTREDERITYELTTELLTTRELQLTTHDRAREAFGLEHTIELVTGIGVYSTICGMLKAFDVAPEGERELL